MELISSDTNIWIDFLTVNCLEEPFTLNDRYKYLMSSDALLDEILSPSGFNTKLIELGLEAVEITEEEYILANTYAEQYRQLSVYDRIALSIASKRGIKLLSGDKALRLAANNERVEVHGTLWVLDELLLNGKVARGRYREILTEMKKFNGKTIRLPKRELEKRLNNE